MILYVFFNISFDRLNNGGPERPPSSEIFQEFLICFFFSESLEIVVLVKIKPSIKFVFTAISQIPSKLLFEISGEILTNIGRVFWLALDRVFNNEKSLFFSINFIFN